MTTTHPSEPMKFATIALSFEVLVQGIFVKELEEGRILVRVGEQDFAAQSMTCFA